MEPHLRKRKMYDLSFRELPFYSLFETGPFLLSPYKVVWKEIATQVACAVQGPCALDSLTNRTVMPDHKLVVLPCEGEDEANFVCALLNSAPARLVAHTYIVGTQISTHVLEYIKVPAFDSAAKIHVRLAELSRRCHAAAASGDIQSVIALEAELDAAAARIWGITDGELVAIRDALPQTVEAGSAEEADGDDNL